MSDCFFCKTPAFTSLRRPKLLIVISHHGNTFSLSRKGFRKYICIYKDIKKYLALCLSLTLNFLSFRKRRGEEKKGGEEKKLTRICTKCLGKIRKFECLNHYLKMSSVCRSRRVSTLFRFGAKKNVQ